MTWGPKFTMRAGVGGLIDPILWCLCGYGGRDKKSSELKSHFEKCKWRRELVKDLGKNIKIYRISCIVW